MICTSEAKYDIAIAKLHIQTPNITLFHYNSLKRKFDDEYFSPLSSTPRFKRIHLYIDTFSFSSVASSFNFDFNKTNDSKLLMRLIY